MSSVLDSVFGNNYLSEGFGEYGQEVLIPSEGYQEAQDGISRCIHKLDMSPLYKLEKRAYYTQAISCYTKASGLFAMADMQSSEEMFNKGVRALESGRSHEHTGDML